MIDRPLYIYTVGFHAVLAFDDKVNACCAMYIYAIYSALVNESEYIESGGTRVESTRHNAFKMR